MSAVSVCLGCILIILAAMRGGSFFARKPFNITFFWHPFSLASSLYTCLGAGAGCCQVGPGAHLHLGTSCCSIPSSFFFLHQSLFCQTEFSEVMFTFWNLFLYIVIESFSPFQNQLQDFLSREPFGHLDQWWWVTTLAKLHLLFLSPVCSWNRVWVNKNWFPQDRQYNMCRWEWMGVGAWIFQKYCNLVQERQGRNTKLTQTNTF